VMTDVRRSDVRDLIPSYRESLAGVQEGIRRAQARAAQGEGEVAVDKARADLALLHGMEADLVWVLTWLVGDGEPLPPERPRVSIVDPSLLEAVTVAPAPMPLTPWRWEVYRKVEDALWRLDEREREAVQMVVCGGLPYREAAELLGCTVSTVHYRAAQGLAKLREWFRALSLAG